MLSSVGEPTSSKIICAWLISDLPSSIGRPSNISAKTQLAMVRDDSKTTRRIKIPSTPHIDGRSVSPQLKQQLGRAVPTSYDEGGVITNGVSVTLARLWHGAIIVTSQTKIGDLE